MFFYNLKNNLKDWKFIFKLSGFLLIMAFSVPTTILSIFIEHWYVNPNTKDAFYAQAWIQNLDITLTFWTTQTTFIAGIWFLIAMFYHNREEKNKFTNFTTQTSLTIYINITGWIFWSGILLNRIFSVNVGLGWFWQLNNQAIIISFFDHLIAPTFMMIYWFLTCGRTKINLVKQLVYVWIYPIIYLSLVYSRAAILNFYHIKNFLYPYDILNLTKPLINISVPANIILVWTIIIGSITGTTGLYCWFNKIFFIAEKPILSPSLLSLKESFIFPKLELNNNF